MGAPLNWPYQSAPYRSALPGVVDGVYKACYRKSRYQEILKTL